MPALPTMAKAGRDDGLQQLEIGTWFGLFGPHGLPPKVLLQLKSAFVAALESAAIHAKPAALMEEAAPTTPEQFAAFVAAELAPYGPVVMASGAKAE